MRQNNIQNGAIQFFLLLPKKSYFVLHKSLGLGGMPGFAGHFLVLRSTTQASLVKATRLSEENFHNIFWSVVYEHHGP